MKNKGEILASILKNFSDCYFFLHNTREFTVVEKILDEGLIFESQLAHTSDQVNPNEPIEISYFLIQRNEYGPYTIIVAIPKDIYMIYSVVSNKNDSGIEEVLTTSEPYFGENDEMIYTLSPKHILGYFNNKTSEFHQNRNWDPLFNSCKSISPYRKLVRSGKK
jgi:hypothetical protein